MTIINPKSIAGVTSITTPSGSDNLFTVHTNNTTERIRINNDGDVIVGSGITVSPDGDIFATGVCTATTFKGDGSNLTGVNSDVVDDTTPQLGGNLDVNTKNIVFGDSGSASDDRLTFGAGTDLSIYHGGDQNYVSATGTGNLNLTSVGAVVTKVNSTEDAIVCNANGSVDLYYDASKKLETTNTGVDVTGNFGMSGSFTGNFVPSTNDSFDLGSSSYQWQDLFLANSVDLVDDAKVLCGTGDDLKLYHSSNNSYLTNDTGYLFVQSDSISLAAKSAGENFLVANKDGAVQLYYDSVNTFKTVSQGIEVLGGEGNNAELFISADEGDDNNDKWKFVAFASPTGTLGLYNYTSGSWETSLLAEGDAGVQLYYDNTLKAQATTGGFHVSGQLSATAASQSSSKAGNFDPYIFSNSANAQDTETVSIKAQKNDCLDLTRYYTAGTIVTFRFNNDFTGHIETGTTSVTYHTSSDYRLKENEVAISDGITRLKQLKPYKFNFIKEPSVVHDGFFAHEVTPVVPTAVSGEKDATETTYYDKGDELPEGKSIGDIKEENAVLPQGLDHSKLVPLLTAALQEAIAKIEVLETKVAALEG